jgi:hydroxypyruvate isomerase
MIKPCVCLETVFPEEPFDNRVRRVAELGFKAFEFWFIDHRFNGKGLTPQEKSISSIVSLIRDNNILLSDFVLNSPDGSIGGSLTKPSDRSLYIKRLRKMIPIAGKMGCQKLITCTGNTVKGIPRKKQHKGIVTTLKKASKIAEKESIILILEPLNSLVDHQGYYLDSPHEAAQIVREVRSHSIKLLFDCYHMQIMNGNLIATIEKNIDIIEHFHSAGVPGRHELFTGELNYPNIVKRIDDLGYDEFFGLEYFPMMPSQVSLKETLKIFE